MAVIEISHFTYTYPGTTKPVINDLHWSIEKNSFIVITGKTGSGKSTLGKALAGFLFQDENPQFSGEILVNGIDMSTIPLYEASERVAYVQQNPEDQFCTLTVMDEVAFGLENRCYPPDEIEARIDQALSNVSGLELKHRSLASLSGGEKQKVAIASMIALSSDVLILDEPTSNLDPQATQEIFDTLNVLRNQLNLTVIIIEHKINQLRSLNPTLFVFEDGQLQLKESIQTEQKFNDGRVLSHVQAKSTDTNFEEPILYLSEANVCRGENHVLQNIDLQLFPGEFTALMGPNGSGKSTLLLTTMGLIKYQTGICEIFSQDLKKTKTSDLVSKIGFIFQNPDHQLFTQSVWEEIIFTTKNLGTLNPFLETQAEHLLQQFELTQKIHDHPQRLSYGEKRRLNLAAILLHKPKLLLLDEILIGQDQASAHIWMSFLRDYADSGNSVLLINHQANMTSTYCNRIIFLADGKKIIDAPTEEAFNSMAEYGYSAFSPIDQKEMDYA